MARRRFSDSELTSMGGARNVFGKESEQSKIRHGKKNRPDPLAGKNTPAGKLKANRKRSKKRLDAINKALGVN